LRKELAENLVHSLKVSHVLEIHIALQNVTPICTTFLEYSTDIAQGLTGLSLNVTDANDVAVSTPRNLPCGVHHIPAFGPGGVGVGWAWLKI
jgi:hypothetical protein